jgi:hypothetical protein
MVHMNVSPGADRNVMDDLKVEEYSPVLLDKNMDQPILNKSGARQNMLLTQKSGERERDQFSAKVMLEAKLFNRRVGECQTETWE